jgi:hypothetical protein
LIVDDLDDGLGGGQAVDDVLADGLLFDGVDELADDLEGDVGLEERDADLAEGKVNVFFGQPSLAPDALEDRLQLFG